MRYVMRQKWLSWGDDFHIQDEGGVNRFFVDGHAFSIGDKLAFQDMQGNELAFISQRNKQRRETKNAENPQGLIPFYVCRASAVNLYLGGPQNIDRRKEF